MNTDNISQINQNWSSQDYIEQRLQPQIDYHSRISRHSKHYYLWIRRTEIIAAVSIPVLIIFAKEFPSISLVIACLGALITLLAGFLLLGDYQRNWINHRATCELLTAEKIKYCTRHGVYKDIEEDILLKDLLVGNVEAILLEENEQWHKAKEKDKKK